MARDTPIGMEFMNWQNAPSLMDTISGKKSPLLNTMGILLAGNGDQSEGVSPPALGQGVSPSTGVGIAPKQPSGLGIGSNQFKLPSLTLPQIGQPGTDLDGDGQIDTFWGLKK
jgi:hypothetical protein